MHRKGKKWAAWHSAFLWHRYLGIVAIPFVFLMSFTGYLINHSGNLGLGKRYIHSNVILNWYGINMPGEIRGYGVNGRWLYQAGSHIYIDKQLTEVATNHLTGAVFHKGNIIASGKNQIFLMTSEGKLIEALNEAHGFPGSIRKVGFTEDEELVIGTDKGNFIARIDELSWEKNDRSVIHWATSENLPADLLDHLLLAYRETGLSIERLILDIHSGRILAPWGTLLVDALTLLILSLSSLGLWIWLSRRDRKQLRIFKERS